LACRFVLSTMMMRCNRRSGQLIGGYLVRRLSMIALGTLWILFVSTTGQARNELQSPENNPDFVRTHLERPAQDNASPYTVLRVHNINNMRLSVTNWGTIGSMAGGLRDPIAGLPAPGMYFPAASNFEHLYLGALWIGAIQGTDSVVSTAHDMFDGLTEFYPESYFNGGGIIERSSRLESPYYDPAAISQQDFICTYFDTLTAPSYVPVDQWSWRPHKPLQVRVRQESFAWTYEYAEDFVIIRYWITNMGENLLPEVWVGFCVDPQVHHMNNVESAWDDLVGFREMMPSIAGYDFQDTSRVLWFADNDGDPEGGRNFTEASPRSVAGIGIIGTPQWIYYSDYGWWDPYQCWRWTCDYSFNWWSPNMNARYDWGPQKMPTRRSWSGGLGEPLGDRHKYFYMSNMETDYDQPWANTDFSNENWFGPPIGDEYLPNNISRGYPSHALLSAGPFYIQPGDSIPIAVALVAGEGFHVDATNARNLPMQQQRYLDNLDFSDLDRNFQWSKWVFDNPGTDTDEDGCSGYFFTKRCRDTIFTWQGHQWHDLVCDTMYYSGDGVADLKGPPPPPSPELTVASEPGIIHLKWDGGKSELFYDDFSHRRDFEGFNVYVGLGHDANSMALMASWDRVNYDRYRYVPEARPSPWVSQEAPWTLDALQQIYGADFDPLLYPGAVSFYEDDLGNRFYFKPHGGNRGNEYVEDGQIVTNRVQFTRLDSLWNEDVKAWELFGHFECIIDGLLPSQPYYFSVTAFDHGFAEGGLGPLESSSKTNMQLAYPSYSPDFVLEKRLEVGVYPNPYKIDAGYRAQGFEDPNREGFLERTRRIHFVNLPPRATIKIFSLDGDLIREIQHPDSRLSDSPSHTAWDMITRNTQAVVSGIYLYSVESEWGTQIGKIVIIK